MEGIAEQDRLPDIKARHLASTPGPYRWFGYVSSKSLSLIGARTNVVLDFIRWTHHFGIWGRGIPAFNVKGILTPATLMLKLHEYHQGGEVLGIDHPDAIALERSWEDREWLIGEIEKLRTQIKATTDYVTEEASCVDSCLSWCGLLSAFRKEE